MCTAFSTHHYSSLSGCGLETRACPPWLTKRSINKKLIAVGEYLRCIGMTTTRTIWALQFYARDMLPKQLLVMTFSTLGHLYYYNSREGENKLPTIVSVLVEMALQGEKPRNRTNVRHTPFGAIAPKGLQIWGSINPTGFILLFWTWWELTCNQTKSTYDLIINHTHIWFVSKEKRCHRKDCKAHAEQFTLQLGSLLLLQKRATIVDPTSRNSYLI